MVISDEIEGVTLVLKPDRGFHHAEVIADVEAAARLDAGKYAHGKLVGTLLS
jgi:hypothetical protein